MAYSLDKCSFYTNPFKDVYYFDTHNKAFSVWGTYANKIGKSMELVTFDSHADTRTAGALYICKNTDDGVIYKDNPEWKHFLSMFNLKINNFNFEDAFRFMLQIGNNEQIKAAYDLGYFNSLNIFTRYEECIWEGFEREDQIEGYNISYYLVHEYESDADALEKICQSAAPVALDIDLDFFVEPFDFESLLGKYIKKLIKKATVITIATEPEYFESCKKEEYEDFKNEDALTILLDVIDSCRRNV